MRGIGRLKNAIRIAISRHRRSAPVKVLHSAAGFIESAYANEGANFERDGEAALLAKLAAFEFQTAFDGGANCGDWSESALAAWPKCSLHAFEVAPETFERLTRRLCAAQKNGRAALNCLGLYDRAGSCEMYYYPERPEQTCDVHRHSNDRAVPFQAELVAGDEYCDARGIAEIDFLKIDVEGAEHKVLRGFAGRISARRIHCIQFEYGAFATQTKFLLVDFFNLLGEFYWIGKIHPTYVDFRDYHWRMEDFRFCNYLCVSKLRPDIRARLAT